jgi:hypothetical protein
MAASMKIRDFWDIVPCSLGVDQRFRGAYCLDHHGGDDDHLDGCKYFILTCSF